VIEEAACFWYHGWLPAILLFCDSGQKSLLVGQSSPEDARDDLLCGYLFICMAE
jgi:hypothetical protein